MTSETGATYITLDEAKSQLGVDPDLTVDDARIQRLIGAAIDWAENFTQRSLGELLELNSPTDSSATPLPNPKDSPSWANGRQLPWDQDPSVDFSLWTPDQWHDYWRQNPVQVDASAPLRRDVKEAILLKLETLYDRNVDNMALLETTALNMLQPYRIAMGV